jgi:hypothetical protein
MLFKTELENLKSQFVTSSWCGRRKRPYVFTEHGTLRVARKNILQQSDYKSLLETVSRIELIMDTFQSTHIIIKRPISIMFLGAQKMCRRRCS